MPGLHLPQKIRGRVFICIAKLRIKTYLQSKLSRSLLYAYNFLFVYSFPPTVSHPAKFTVGKFQKKRHYGLKYLQMFLHIFVHFL